VRELFESAWGVTLEREPGLRISQHVRGLPRRNVPCMYVQGEDFVSVRSNTHHITKAMEAWNASLCGSVYERDRRSPHRVLPGSSFLEKDGTLPRRAPHSPIRRSWSRVPVMRIREVTVMLSTL